MMPPVVRSVAAPSGAVFDHGRRSTSAMWTGEKRRRTFGGPSPRPLGLGSSSDDTTDAMLMDDDSDTRPQLQEEQGGRVFSAEDDIDQEELIRCWRLLSSFERPVCFRRARTLKGEDVKEVVQRLYALRFRDYKRLKDGSLNCDDTVPATESEYPDEVFDWDNLFKPGPSIFGWTYDPHYFDLAELDDYQRIVPTRADVDEYYEFEKYRLIFSCYETDEAYVKYWHELSKQMKWVEDALLLDHKEFPRYENRGEWQAIKIAAGFCHLPASLATLGYEEYVLALRYDLDRRKDYDLVYFEVWKRMSKQEMSFEEALKDILSSENKLPSSCLFRIQAQLKSCWGQMLCDYNACMDHIRKLVIECGEGGVSKKHFTDAVYSKIPRPKMYVDYVKKKLEVARRIHLMPGMGLPPWTENGHSDSEIRAESVKYRVGACTHNASIVYGT